MGEFRKALALRQKVADANADEPGFRFELAESNNTVGFVKEQLGKPAEALGAYRQALGHFQKLAGDYRAVAKFQFRLAETHLHVGDALAATRKPADALSEYRKAKTFSRSWFKTISPSPTSSSIWPASTTASANCSWGRTSPRQRRTNSAKRCTSCSLWSKTNPQ